MRIKISNIGIGILFLILGIVFFIYSQEMGNVAMYLEQKLEFYYTGSNPQCPYYIDLDTCNRLEESLKYELDIAKNLLVLFQTLAWIFFAFAIIILILVVREAELRQEKDIK